MRYLLSCVLASVILLGLTACGSSTADPSTDTVVQGDETAEAQESIEESQGEQTQVNLELLFNAVSKGAIKPESATSKSNAL